LEPWWILFYSTGWGEPKACPALTRVQFNFIAERNAIVRLDDLRMCRDVFVDESSQTKHRYLLLGGVISRIQETELTAALTAARGAELPRGELGWVKVSRGKLAAYTRFVDVFFTGEMAAHLDFHSIVVDTSRIDDRTYNAGSRQAGFDKEVYQLLLKFGRLYNACSFHGYLDQRSTPGDLSELREIVNRGMMKIYPPRDWPLRRLHFRDSSGCQALQLVDVLIGAIAFHLNGHRQKADASPAKCELSDYILASAGVTDPFKDTQHSGKFTIWHRQLRKPIYRR
jgi:hypothetical protein